MVDEEDGTTTIPLKKSTRDRLAKWTGKGRTYNEAINHLLDRVKAPE